MSCLAPWGAVLPKWQPLHPKHDGQSLVAPWGKRDICSISPGKRIVPAVWLLKSNSPHCCLEFILCSRHHGRALAGTGSTSIDPAPAPTWHISLACMPHYMFVKLSIGGGPALDCLDQAPKRLSEIIIQEHFVNFCWVIFNKLNAQ